MCHILSDTLEMNIISSIDIFSTCQISSLLKGMFSLGVPKGGALHECGEGVLTQKRFYLISN